MSSRRPRASEDDIVIDLSSIGAILLMFGILLTVVVLMRGIAMDVAPGGEDDGISYHLVPEPFSLGMALCLISVGLLLAIRSKRSSTGADTDEGHSIPRRIL